MEVLAEGGEQGAGRKAKSPGFETLARAVPSGLRGLTTVFGMGTGGTLSL
jgi:hypothetical protein